MGKYLDIKIGKEIKLFRFASGSKQDGSRWALFSFTPYEKNDKGDYIYGQEYTIFINNINDVNYQLRDGDKVEITNIYSVSAEDNTYKGKDGIQHTKRVIKVVVDIRINNQVNDSNNQNDIVEESKPVFDGGYDMPDF